MADDEVAGQPAGLPDDVTGPASEPKSSKSWLSMIADAEKVFEEYHDKADNIDKLYASLEKLASISRDRQFQLFWANIGVVGPSIYARPPIPVIVPRFKDRKPLPRAASELLERSTVVAFEQEDIDAVMRAIRDDLTVLARGCAWVRYEAAEKGENYLSERVCIEHTDRRDFLHEPARDWKDVDWVAKRSFLTKKAMRKRFSKFSKDAYKDAAYEKRKDGKQFDDGKLKAPVWELWCKSVNKVVWVTEGVEVTLDEGKPHLTLDGFFPCPRPAYATTQRGTLVPVPDMLFYKDQLEEINEITARVSALTDALKVRGFYPAGAGEIGDAIEAAVKKQTDNQVLIPVSNWAMVGSGGVKDMIVWLPLDMIATTIKELIELRKQLIDDVYQITGLSDIMRGSTVASETLGAQELKSQYGSVRIRDRQGELVRFARDLTRITAEIMSENFQQRTLLEMSQLDIATDEWVQSQVLPLQQQAQSIQSQLQQAQADPQVQQMAQQNPEKAQQVIGQVQQQLQQIQGQAQKVQQTITIEQVIKFLRDQRVRPFVLDIETDSTIAPDENATKQRATEFVTAVGGFMAQAIPLVQTMPEAAKLTAETLKFVASQYRAGRELESSIEEFADQMAQVAAQPKPPNPEQVKAQAEAQATQADAMEKQANAKKIATEADTKKADADLERRVREQEAMDAAAQRQADLDAKREMAQLDMTLKREKHGQEMQMMAHKTEQARCDMECAKTNAMKEMNGADETETEKPPSESINFKDLPPEGQSQMAAQAGIDLSPETLASHANDMAEQALKAKQAAKPKAVEPA